MIVQVVAGAQIGAEQAQVQRYIEADVQMHRYGCAEVQRSLCGGAEVQRGCFMQR